MRTSVMCLLVAIAGSWTPISARAELAGLSSSELREAANQVVIGTLQRVYSAASQREGGYAKTWSVAAVSVEKVEKGDDLRVSELIYARYWTQTWVAGEPVPPGTRGQWELPAAGSKVRVHLQRAADGGWDVVLPNGFTNLEDPVRKP